MTEKTKREVIEQFSGNPKDTGSTSVQIALITQRIQQLTEHMQNNKKDVSSKRGLLKLVDSRKRLLSYLDRTDHARYLEVIKKLNIRK
ncbi:MAG: 30S ribosomal protein S15 [Candidatus Babeliales bacterium]